jgi:hypothetical protein
MLEQLQSNVPSLSRVFYNRVPVVAGFTKWWYDGKSQLLSDASLVLPELGVMFEGRWSKGKGVLDTTMSVEANAKAVLTSILPFLQDHCCWAPPSFRQKDDDGLWAFVYPLKEQKFEQVHANGGTWLCMEASKPKLKAGGHPHIKVDGNGYVVVHCGTKPTRGKKSQAIWVSAHRLIVWAMAGPFAMVGDQEVLPMSAKGAPLSRRLVVMHSCDNKLCLSPSHLRLGTSYDNYGASTKATPPPKQRASEAPPRLVEMIAKVMEGAQH